MSYYQPYIVRVGGKGTLTLPLSIFKQLKIKKGDFFEVQAAQTMLILSQKNVLDDGIREGLADIRIGRTHGPFSTSKEALTFLHNQKKSVKRKKE